MLFFILWLRDVHLLLKNFIFINSDFSFFRHSYTFPCFFSFNLIMIPVVYLTFMKKSSISLLQRTRWIYIRRRNFWKRAGFPRYRPRPSLGRILLIRRSFSIRSTWNYSKHLEDFLSKLKGLEIGYRTLTSCGVELPKGLSF